MATIREPVQCLQKRMHSIQSNLSEIRDIMAVWARVPLFERKDSKKDSVLCLEERLDRKTKRYAEIQAASESVHKYSCGHC